MRFAVCSRSMASRKTAAAEAPAQETTSEPEPLVLDDDDVRRRVAAGELVPLPRWGEPPVREHMLAQLRANVSRPRTRPKAD